MIIRCHGGSCCGIKHIYGFGKDPTCQIGVVASRLLTTEDLFPGPAPVETYHDRLKRLLRWFPSYQSRGLIEVALVDTPRHYQDQAEKWEPILLDIGFKKVTSFFNSNSQRTVAVYHLDTNEVNKDAIAEKPKPKGAVGMVRDAAGKFTGKA